MKYKVIRNRCSCHPETCCCNPYLVVDENGTKVASTFTEKEADKLVILLTPPEVSE